MRSSPAYVHLADGVLCGGEGHTASGSMWRIAGRRAALFRRLRCSARPARSGRQPLAEVSRSRSRHWRPSCGAVSPRAGSDGAPPGQPSSALGARAASLTDSDCEAAVKTMPRPRLGATDAAALSQAAPRRGGRPQAQAAAKASRQERLGHPESPRERGMHGWRDRNGRASVADPLATRPAQYGDRDQQREGRPTAAPHSNAGNRQLGGSTEQIGRCGLGQSLPPPPDIGASEKLSIARASADALAGTPPTALLVGAELRPAACWRSTRCRSFGAGRTSGVARATRPAASRSGSRRRAVVAFMSQDRVKGGLIEEGNGGRPTHTHPRSHQARAERAWLRVGDHHRPPAGSRVANPRRREKKRREARVLAPSCPPRARTVTTDPQRRQQHNHDGVDVGRGIAEALPEESRSGGEGRAPSRPAQ